MENKKCFHCIKEKCETSCCGVFNGFSDRLNSLDGRSFSEIILTDNDAQKLLHSEFKGLVYQGDDQLYRIITAQDGTCSAYQSGKCIIHAIKPTVCKSYPLYLDLYVGLCSQKDCVAVNPQHDLDSYHNEIDAFIQMCEFWIQYYKEHTIL